ncbi:hypothetical protein BKA65DRAFT_164409 [Rhexocercosporidium sp. MPI-PUGE-AT-0058]|nr:hypothetical protein BKA65DRAFT_164409 [Rhexocercosporidium sp. MPI-PUGE-AT-0058]
MWKRLNNPRGTRQPVVQGQEPVLEKSYASVGDDLGLLGQNRRAATDGSYGNQNYHNNRAPDRPRREDEMAPKGLPRLPFEAVPPHENRDSRLRPASSIYSQPSPNPINTRFPLNQNPYQTPSYTEEEEVSPQSSPELRPQRNRSQSQEDEGVSPIDEMPDISHLGLGRPASSSKPPSSNIPILRREKRNQVAAAAANLVSRKQVGENPRGRVAHDPRWDPYSGEITTSDRGKPQSVKPGTFSPPGLRSVHKETGLVLGNESSITTTAPKAHTSFGDRVRRLKSNHAAPAERPEWKGATGRVTLVSPVHDQLDIPPISIPRKSSKRVASPHSETFSGGSSPVTIVRNGDGETSPASPAYPTASIRTVLTNNSGKNSPRVQSPITVNPDPVVVSQSAATKILARNASSPSEPQVPGGWERDEGTMANIERNFREQLQSVSTPITEEPEPEYIQPSSRFSVTTYAPSTAHSTPRPSTDTFENHPMPDPSAIVNRQRPRLSESPKANNAVTRKAVNPSSPVFISMSSVPAHMAPNKRSSNIAKNLPMSPAEAESHDLVTSLQAQLENLAHRRNNITRSIRQMTELMPKDSVLLTEDVRRKREQEKIKVERLREEESDVRREEHEIGLRLHRAWKRRDKDAVFEPTGLWVRRVTG